MLVATTLPVASTTATFTPVRYPGSSPSVGRGPAGAASRRSRRLEAKTRTASSSAAPHRRTRRSIDSVTKILVRQAQRAASYEPFVTRTAPIGDAERAHDAQLVSADRRARRRIIGLDGEVEDVFPFAAAQRQNAMRWHLVQGLRKFEIVLEFRAGFLLCRRARRT